MNHVPRYLALDIGTHTGWAIVEGDKIVDSGVRDLSVKAAEHIGKRGIMFHNFLLSLGHIDEIFYEKVQFTFNKFRSDGGELQKGLLMVMNMYSALFNVPANGTWPTTLKKAFTGRGDADKVTMCKIAHEMGWAGGSPGTDLDHDEADAIALLVTQLRDKYNILVSF